MCMRVCKCYCECLVTKKLSHFESYLHSSKSIREKHLGMLILLVKPPTTINIAFMVFLTCSSDVFLMIEDIYEDN